MDDSGELQCIGRLEIAKPKPVGFLCGTLLVPTDSAFPSSHSALVPSPPPHTIGAPQYQMLPNETDLNSLPALSNWSENVFPAAAKPSEGLHWESGPLSQNLSRKCEALAVSGLTEYGDEIDVVAPTDILKQIFKIPYSKGQLSIAVQRIGDTLILNTGPDVEEGEKIYRRQSNQSKGSDPSIFLNFAMHSVRAEACDCPPTHHPSSEKPASSPILPGFFGSRDGSFGASSNSHASESQYHYKSVNGSRKSAESNHDKYFLGTKHTKQKGKRPDSVNRTSEVGEKPRCPVQDSDKFRKGGNDGFLRVLFWQFHNFRMLLGSDMLIFSNEKYVAVSLHLWDIARQVTPLTWLEAWLDNVMASVPELAICYHNNGVVQGYELLKTDDIFRKGISEDGTPAFHPQAVQQNGLSVLRFLQDNCKQDPGAYWLYKSAGEDVIQLFDLSVIPKNHSDNDHDKIHNSLASLMHKGRKESLFSLGTLLYRVAHRLSLSKASDNSAKCARFFRNCLDFLRDQDHLVVRAYAHEQFARLILKCYEELELTSESFLLESEVTVPNLEDESSEFSLGMFGSAMKDMVQSEATDDGSVLQSSISNSSGSNLGSVSYNVSPETKVEGFMNGVASSKPHDNLDMCQMSSTSPQMVKEVPDPISSKLAAIHHVSQAIKSLRWKRQLQNAQGDLVDQGNRIRDRSSDFSVCGCGDANCIEVCDIREWLPKSKLDQKMWNLVLLLGESYLALGEAYKDDEQLHRALKVVELACLVYGSMPQHLEDTQFISSMVDDSLHPLKVKNGEEQRELAIDVAEDLGCNIFEGYSAERSSSANLFWAKAWSLVGDVYVEFRFTMGKGNPVQAERKTLGSEVRMSNEVVREVTRLKKKLGQYKRNCSTCSLINCSCQSDRASSGNSASSSSRGSTPYSRKNNQKTNTRHSLHSVVEETFDDSNSQRKGSAKLSVEHPENNHDRETAPTPLEDFELRESSVTANGGGHKHVMVGHNDVKKAQKTSSIDDACSESRAKYPPESRRGGIFKFLASPRLADVENNLSVAIACYDAARKAIGLLSTRSAELNSILKKMGWACNELGRYRLENKDLAAAEISFADAIKAFKEVSDHTNIILINCNLGHGRRALAEELVTKMDELQKHDIFQTAYKQAMKTAKLEYFESLKYYGAAKMELSSASDLPDHAVLHNEVYTQFAHTYLRLGMLLAREVTLVDDTDSRHLDNKGKNKERERGEMSAGDAFREALSTYESLGNLRKQEAAYAHYQLACYHRNTCLNFLDFDRKPVKVCHYETSRQKAKWYASLAEKHWQKSADFYGPKTHSDMYLKILMERSTLSWSLSNSLHSNMLLEAALLHLLDGRHVADINEDGKADHHHEIGAKFWTQLQALLKNMLSASLSGSSKAGGAGPAAASARLSDSNKLKEMYRLSLKSTSLDQLHAILRLWVS